MHVPIRMETCKYFRIQEAQPTFVIHTRKAAKYKHFDQANSY